MSDIEFVSEHELKVEVLQMTPIIHFQAEDYEEATIRASEVKPKLDKFLLYCMPDKLEKFKKFTIGRKDDDDSKTLAFDYRLQVDIQGENTLVSLNGDNGRAYGAQVSIGQEGSTDKARMTFGTITLSFLSIHAELLRFIKMVLPLFFAVNNFGKRQSKGFGSFWLKGHDFMRFVNALSIWARVEASYQKKELESINGKALSKYVYTWSNKSDREDYITPLNSIRDTYQFMKAGRTVQDEWKSFLLKWYRKFRKDGGTLSNEKIGIKQKLLSKLPDVDSLGFKAIRTARYYDSEEITEYPWKEENCRYVRAMLGLADHFDMPVLRDMDMDKASGSTTVQIEGVSIEKDSNEKVLQRFRSPIIFRPIYFLDLKKWLIVVIPTRVPQKMYNQPFKFYLEEVISGKTVEAETPKAVEFNTPHNLSEFNLLQFLKDYFTKNRAFSELKTLSELEGNHGR